MLDQVHIRIWEAVHQDKTQPLVVLRRRQNLRMNPRVGEKRKVRNDASWPGFWLSDAELDDIVTRVMTAYEDHHQDEVARAFVSGGGTTTAAPF